MEEYRFQQKAPQIQKLLNKVPTIEAELGVQVQSEVSVQLTGFSWEDNKQMYAKTLPNEEYHIGQSRTLPGSKLSGYVPISVDSDAAVLRYTNMVSTTAQQNLFVGLCFFDQSYQPISGVTFEGDGAEKSYKTITVPIPADAKYVRFTCYDEFFNDFSASIVYTQVTYINGLGKKVNDVYDKVFTDEIRLDPVLCRRRFYLAMTEWCINHGIEDAIIEGGGGFGAGCEVEDEVLGHGLATLSVADFAKIFAVGSSYNTLCNIESEKKHIVYSKGNEREILLQSSLIRSEGVSELTNYYNVLFFKTGGGVATIPGTGEEIMPEDTYNVGAICQHDDFDGKLVLGVVRTNSSRVNMWKSIKCLMDIAKKKINNEDITSSDTDVLDTLGCTNAIAVILPYGNTQLYHSVNFATDSNYLLYSKNATDPIYALSMIKVLTAIVVLNYVADLDMQATITEEDRSSATPLSSAYNLFQGGEKLTIRDLLYASLLSSSNTANYVLARVVGQFLLETYGSKGFIPEDNPGE